MTPLVQQPGGATILPFRQPSIRDLVFDLQAAQGREIAAYAADDLLTPGGQDRITDAENAAAELRRQIVARVQSAIGVSYSQLSEVLS